MNKTSRGDRAVQIILLLLIAGGIGMIAYFNISGSKPAGMPGARGGRPSGGDSQDIAVAVEALEAGRSDVFQFIRVNGDVTVDTAVDIYSDTGGRIVSRRISLGDSVRRNDPLMIVDPSLPGQNYGVSTVRSTISGTVIDIPYNVGDRVTTSAPIATIGDLDDLIIMTYVPERFVSTLREGLTAEVVLDAFPGETFSAEIKEINPVMDVSTRTLSVKLSLINRDSRIRPGMFASMKLITNESSNTISIPSRAVLSYYGDQIVYVINSEGQAERRLIRTGLSTDETVEVLEGIMEGEMVITQGQGRLTDGTSVRAIDPGEIL